jgi:hypothetical protein
MSSSNASGSVPAEAGRPTAEIIPFPLRPRAEPRPDDRLAKALQSLNAALADQRVALAEWRAALGDLKDTTKGLGDSLQRYRTNLGTLGKSVSALNGQARSLEQWADCVVGKNERPDQPR